MTDLDTRFDPMVSLAFAVQANKGGYALLLGSGVSGPAGIKPGWQIVKDLVAQVAKLSEVAPAEDPLKWFRRIRGTDPDYSHLLAELAPTRDERKQLLRGYFEPTEEERRQGLKEPTIAHKAIARLVRDGFIRVMVTTNFDRLLELALEEEGIRPDVVSTPEGAEGALPLVHQKALVIKVHGDYRDARIKNTSGELKTYHRRLNMMLGRVFDDFGLIVCGWSAEWDYALRAALERGAGRRFTTYWTIRERLTDEAKKLIDHRSAVRVPIKDANAFFKKLGEMVDGLDRARRSHPLTVAALGEVTKRYLPDPKATIELHDLVSEEVERARTVIWPAIDGVVGKNKTWTAETMKDFLASIRAAIERPQAVLIHGCAWGTHAHTRLWVSAIEDISNRPFRQGAYIDEPLIYYAGTIFTYAGGIAAVAQGQLSTVRQLILGPIFRSFDRKDNFMTRAVISNLRKVVNFVPGRSDQVLALSKHLHSILRDPLRPYLSNDDAYSEAFDWFEYFQALLFASELKPSWVPIGRFALTFAMSARAENSVVRIAAGELQAQGKDWPPLKAGFCGGSTEIASAAQKEIGERAAKVGMEASFGG